MIDLCRHIPRLKDCDRVIVTGGAESLYEHADEILNRLDLEPKTAWYEVNTYLSNYRPERVSKLKNVMVEFALDFNHPNNANDDVKTARAIRSNKNFRFIVMDGIPNNLYARKLEILNQCIFVHAPMKCLPGNEDEELQSNPNMVLTGGTSTLTAFSCVPDHITKIDVYGCDDLKNKNKNGKYKTQMKIAIPWIEHFRKTKEINFI